MRQSVNNTQQQQHNQTNPIISNSVQATPQRRNLVQNNIRNNNVNRNNMNNQQQQQPTQINSQQQQLSRTPQISHATRQLQNLQQQFHNFSAQNNSNTSINANMNDNTNNNNTNSPPPLPPLPQNNIPINLITATSSSNSNLQRNQPFLLEQSSLQQGRQRSPHSNIIRYWEQNGNQQQQQNHQNSSNNNNGNGLFQNLIQNPNQQGIRIGHPNQFPVLLSHQQQGRGGIPQQRNSFPVHMQVNIQFIPRPDGLDVNNIKDSDNFKNFLENFADKDNYMCQICQNILWDSTSCNKCQKNFCLECVGYWLQTKNQCPTCREKFEMKKIDNSIKNNLAILSFKCPNEGCEEVPNYEIYYKHSQNCEFTEIKCKNEDCDFKNIRKEYGLHDQNCDHQLQPCKWCKKQYKKINLSEHSDQCDQRQMHCTNTDCEDKVPQIHLDEHVKNCGHLLITCDQCKESYKQKNFQSHRQECEFNEVKCRGCKETLYKKDIDEHESNCPDFEIECESCSSRFQRKNENNHTEIACLKQSNAILINSKKHQDNVIIGLQNDNDQINKQMDHLKHCMANLYEIVHKQLKCQCREIGEEQCIMHGSLRNFNSQ